MRTTFFFLLAFGLSALADATFSSPKSGDKWSKGKSQMISWDSSSLSSGNCDIHLVPAGAKDTTTIITEVALQVSNSGSYSWTPSSSISVAEAEIIIVDSKKTSIISSVFTLITESSDSSGKDSGSYNNGHDNSGKDSGSNNNGYDNNGKDSGSYNNGYDNSGKDSGSNNNGYDNSGKDSGSYNNGYDNSGKNSSSNNNGYDNGGSKSTKSKSYETKTKATMNLYTHASYMKTYESKGHETKTETETETKGGEYTKSLETTSFLTIGLNGTYYMGSTSLTTVQVTTTVAGALTTYAMTTSITPPEATTTEAATTEAPPPPAETTVASNGTLAVNATPTAITFTGAAPGSPSTFYSTAVGCVVGLVAMLLL